MKKNLYTHFPGVFRLLMILIPAILFANSNMAQGTQDIYVFNAKSGNTERITFLDDASEYNPSFSNDGKKIAHDVVGGLVPFGNSIYITDVKSGVSTLLAGAEGGNDPSWSPDGMLIVFDLIPIGQPNIYVVPPTGGTPILVKENAIDAEWSNNSKRLVFTDINDYSLRTVDVSGGSETILGVFGVNASWSPNGKSIAYTDGNNIFVVEVNEAGEPLGAPVMLTNDGTDIYSQQPSWSNDSKTIVFHSNRGNTVYDFDIWTVSADGGTPVLLTGAAGYGDFDPAYSKNGKYVAYDAYTVPPAPATLLNVSSNAISEQFTLAPNYPNPFKETTAIEFSITQSNYTKLVVYNSVGMEVATLYDGMAEANQVYKVKFSASGLAGGVYFYQLQSGENVNTMKKMMLIK